MNWSKWMRQVHRWLSVAFAAVVFGIFGALAMGQEPAEWVYFLPLPPLALLLATGLYLFLLPYVTKWRSRRRAAASA